MDACREGSCSAQHHLHGVSDACLSFDVIFLMGALQTPHNPRHALCARAQGCMNDSLVCSAGHPGALATCEMATHACERQHCWMGEQGSHRSQWSSGRCNCSSRNLVRNVQLVGTQPCSHMGEQYRFPKFGQPHSACAEHPLTVSVRWTSAQQKLVVLYAQNVGLATCYMLQASVPSSGTIFWSTLAFRTGYAGVENAICWSKCA